MEVFGSVRLVFQNTHGFRHLIRKKYLTHNGVLRAFSVRFQNKGFQNDR